VKLGLLVCIVGLMGLAASPGPAWAADAPAPSAPAAKGGMSPVVLAKLVSLITRAGHDTDLPGPIAAALGLPNTGQPWPDRQFAVQSHGPEALHAVALGQGEGADIVLSVKGPAAISIFRADRHGALLGATTYFPETRLTMTPPAATAAADFGTECAFWAIHVDALISVE
jgi:hypothetical protein